jgi:ribose transport system ATP-binding protein
MTQPPAAAPHRFAMRGIRKAFGATVALDGVDLSVSEGEICGLIGQNGAGKSTLMSILSGALPPDAGELSIDGRPFVPHSPLDARRAGVAMIYQELSLAPHLSVMENIMMGAEPMRYGLVDWPRMREMAARALAALGHDDIPPDATVGHL